MSLDEYNTIVIEPIIKSTESLDVLKESTATLLESNDLKVQSVNTEGYFIILRLSDPSKSVNAIAILRRLSGVAFIFIGVSVKLDHDIIVNTAIDIHSNMILNDETYQILVRSTTLVADHRESIVEKFDLEFHIHSELDAKSGRSKLLENDREEADVIIYILLGSNRCYISKLAFKGQDIIPLNYLKESILCPIFDNVSMISFFSVLKSGYYPVPIFIYLEKQSMKKMLKIFGNVITGLPITSMDIYALSMGEHISKLVQKVICSDDRNEIMIKEPQKSYWLIFLLAIIEILKETKFQINKVGLPLTPYAHPWWLIKETIAIFDGSQKTAFTPLLFNYPSREFEMQISRLAKLGLESEAGLDNLRQIGELEHEEFRILIKEITTNHLIPSLSEYLKKYNLRVREDDILDIFDSI
ncbi:MAG TPA: hypothetical protein VJR94_07430 [Candidatus Nitrosocosmicus sp.]|nr:hypothetical protein [Candidatus Nitrosocosmicus sp.]